MLTVAPVTSVPGVTSSGMLSPVSIERSMAEEPSRITPSVATFSPGLTTKTSPTRTAPMGTSTSAVLPSD